MQAVDPVAPVEIEGLTALFEVVHELSHEMCSRRAAGCPTTGGRRPSWWSSCCGSQGIVLLWYSVLAVRVPHLREVVRALYRRLLVRRSLLAGAATAPAVTLA